MNRRSTSLLKGAVCIIGLAVLAICGIILVAMIKEGAWAPADIAWAFYPMILILYASTVPFFMALYQAFKMLLSIDNNTAFSLASVQALRKIKYCAITISILYVLSLPFLYRLTHYDDAPGIILLGLIFIFASGVIATFSAVLEKLLHNVIALKTENDLTV